MKCERCGKYADALHGLGSAYNKPTKQPFIKVCADCCNEWIRYLDSELIRRKLPKFLQIGIPLDKDELWQEIFWNWCGKEKVIFI